MNKEIVDLWWAMLAGLMGLLVGIALGMLIMLEICRA